jgi:hypothetical protein
MIRIIDRNNEKNPTHPVFYADTQNITFFKYDEHFKKVIPSITIQKDCIIAVSQVYLANPDGIFVDLLIHKESEGINKPSTISVELNHEYIDLETNNSKSDWEYNPERIFACPSYNDPNAKFYDFVSIYNRKNIDMLLKLREEITSVIF